MVTITTLTRGIRSFILLVASKPSALGMRTSIKTRSGLRLRQASMACRPSSTSPTTSRSGSVASTALSPSRTRRWSSAMRTRALRPSPEISPSMPAILLGERYLRHHLGTGSRLAMDLEVAAEQGDPFPHAGDTDPLTRTVSGRYLIGTESLSPVSNPEADGPVQAVERDPHPVGGRVFVSVH